MPLPPGIETKRVDETLAATKHTVVKNRDELQQVLQELVRKIPEGSVNGPGFAVFWGVTSVTDGFEVDLGYPVSEPYDGDGIHTRIMPALEVLSTLHEGPPAELRQTLIRLHGFAGERAIISDEFRREVYHADGKIELQFVIHNWNERLARNLARVLDPDKSRAVLLGCEALTLDSSPDERFQWTKGMVERLDALAAPAQKYDILSSCAHVFPPGQINKLTEVFNQAIARGKNGLEAVDAVIDFMELDPGWAERPRREGRTLYSAKQPRDPEGYAKASTQLEKCKAYCFCPLLRNNMDQGMPLTFCNCGAGWYRQQWEGATGKPVWIEIVKSVSRGDDTCEFAIHLAEDL